MVATQTPPRTPLHAMSDAQLLFIAEDDTVLHERRMLAVELLQDRLYEDPSPELSSIVERIAEYTAR